MPIINAPARNAAEAQVFAVTGEQVTLTEDQVHTRRRQIWVA
jgi:hypothetical protein